MAERVVLAIDTSASVVSAVAVDDVAVASMRVDDRMAHAEQLAPLVRRTVAAAGQTLDAVTEIVVGLGPGPFTGLRVGIVTAQVLAATLGVPLHGVCSLDAIAAAHAAWTPTGEFIVVADARRREVYWARYTPAGVRVGEPKVGPASELPRLPAVGPGVELYPDALLASEGPRALDGAVLAVRGPGLPPAGTHPLYLRHPDAAEPGRRKPVLLAPRRD